jgi:hypothetical protein
MDNNVLFDVHPMQQFKQHKQTAMAFMIIIIQFIDILQNIISVSAITMYPQTEILWQQNQSPASMFISLAVARQMAMNP